eukprot:639857-Rhodomonas_salina.3
MQVRMMVEMVIGFARGTQAMAVTEQTVMQTVPIPSSKSASCRHPPRFAADTCRIASVSGDATYAGQEGSPTGENVSILSAPPFFSILRNLRPRICPPSLGLGLCLSLSLVLSVGRSIILSPATRPGLRPFVCLSLRFSLSLSEQETHHSISSQMVWRTIDQRLESRLMAYYPTSMPRETDATDMVCFSPNSLPFRAPQVQNL